MKKTNFFISLFLLFSIPILLAQTPMYYNFNTGTSNNVFPFGVTAGKMVQWLILPDGFNQPSSAPSGYITKMYFFMGASMTNTYSSGFFIRLGQSTITDLPSGVIYTGTMDTVFSSVPFSLTSVSGQWMSIALQRPYLYDSTKSLIIEIGQCGMTGGSMTIRQTSLTGQKRCYINHSGGCTWAYSGQDASVGNIGIDIVRATPMHYNYLGNGTNNSFPLGISTGKMVQWLFMPAGQTGSWNLPTPPDAGGIINAFYMLIGTSYPITDKTYTALRLLYGQTTLTTLTQGQFYSGTLDTVYVRMTQLINAPGGSWLAFIWDTPKPYNPTLSTVIQIEQAGFTPSGSSFYPQCQTSLTPYRRVWSVGGPPFVPYTTSDGYTLHSGLSVYYPTGTNNNNNNQVPQAYSLEQNYPNPFNPVTTINYAIPKAGKVELKIYDVLGREVAVLVNEFKQAGSYKADFDASNLASGVYLYTLRSGDFTASKKMILEK
jgi:hypothetical protein